MKVELTKAQCEVVSEFIEMNLFDVIRKDVDIDNYGWVRAMIQAKEILEAAAKMDGGAENG